MNYRIGIDGSALTKNHPTGVEVASRELMTALFDLDTENHYLVYSATPLSRKWADKPNVTNVVISGSQFWTQKALPAQIQADRLDIFWSPAYMLPPRLKGIKTIATVHDLAFIKFPLAYSMRDWLLSFYTVLRAKFAATRIVAVSRQTAIDLKKYFWIGPRRIKVIYNAVSHLHLRPTLKDIHAKYHLPEQFVLVVGRLEARKNSLNILMSFKNLAQNHPDLHLVFAGSANRLSRRMAAKARELGVADRVHFVGFVHELDLPMLYRAAEVLLFPSLYEGFGLPILEAFAAGTPVVTTNFGATAEIAKKAAVLIDPTNVNAITWSVTYLLNDEELKTKYIQAGYERLKDFSWEESAKRLKSLIDGL